MKRQLAALLMICCQLAHGQVTIGNLVINPSFGNNLQNWSTNVGKQACSPNAGGGVCYNGGTAVVFSYTNGVVYNNIDLTEFRAAYGNLLSAGFSVLVSTTWTQTAAGYNNSNNTNDTYGIAIDAYNGATWLAGASYNYTGSHGWLERSVSITNNANLEQATRIVVSLSGRDGGFWAGNYGPSFANPYLEGTFGLPLCVAPPAQVSYGGCAAHQSGKITTMVEFTCPDPHGSPVASQSTVNSCVQDPPSCIPPQATTVVQTTPSAEITTVTTYACPDPYGSVVATNSTTVVPKVSAGAMAAAGAALSAVPAPPSAPSSSSSSGGSGGGDNKQKSSDSGSKDGDKEGVSVDTGGRSGGKDSKSAGTGTTATAADRVSALKITPALLAIIAQQTAEAVAAGNMAAGQEVAIALMSGQGANSDKYLAKAITDRAFYESRAFYENQRTHDNPRVRNLEQYNEQRWLDMVGEQWGRDKN